LGLSLNTVTGAISGTPAYYSSNKTYTVTAVNCSGSTTGTLNIAVTCNNSTGDTTATACGSFAWYGTTYNNTGTAIHVFKNSKGCDSTVTLHLTINKITPKTINVNLSGCNSYVYKGVTYTSSAIVRDTVRSVPGCDSIYNIANIVITKSVTPSVSLGSTSVVANGSPVTFTATATNGGTSPTYIFTVNSIIVQSGTSHTYTSSALKAGDSVVCSVISNVTCVTTATAVSLPVIMTKNVPVTLVNFRADPAGANTNCIWQTTAEVNTAYYIVERSIDGNSFTDIGKLNATGNANTISNYTYSDVDVTGIKNVTVLYYRLQMVDKDGYFTYSKIVKVELTIKNEFSIYPNPVKDGVMHVQMNLRDKKIIVFKLIDNTGRVLLTKQVEGVKGGNNITLRAGNIAGGTYYLQAVGVEGVKEIQIR